MAIPDFQTIMLPLLQALEDKEKHAIAELYKEISDQFKLSDDEREHLLPSGRETVIKNRVSWARTYLKKAGLVFSPAKGVVQITERGSDVLDERPSKIDNHFLRRFDEFNEFRPLAATNDELPDDSGITIDTPEEMLSKAFSEIQGGLATDLHEQVKKTSPRFFENLVVDLMLSLGYGGSRKAAGEATRYSKDGGIDGVIREDRLGLDKIYLQAKRYTDTAVGPGEVREFVGALHNERAQKGVFITTSRFTPEARNSAAGGNVVLIDGERLVELMIDHDVGVSVKETIRIKQIDSDYFDET